MALTTTTASSSSLLLCLNSKALSLHNPKVVSFSLTQYSSLNQNLKAKSTDVSFSPLLNKLSSRFVTNVALFDQDEEVYSDSDDVASSADMKLYVGNLPFTVETDDLAELFGTTGNVDNVELIYDKISGRSRGFAFVTMASVEEAEAAAQQFNGYEYEGRTLRVNSGPPPPRREDSSFGSPRDSNFRNSRDGNSRGDYGRGGGERSSFRSSRGDYGRGGEERSSFRSPRGDFGRGGEERSSFRSPRGDFGRGGGGGGRSDDGGNRLYVGNLSYGVDDMALETLFSEQGKVVEARVVYDRESGRSRGFGFVSYGSSQEMDKAIDSLNGAYQVLRGKMLTCHLSKSVFFRIWMEDLSELVLLKPSRDDHFKLGTVPTSVNSRKCSRFLGNTMLQPFVFIKVLLLVVVETKLGIVFCAAPYLIAWILNISKLFKILSSNNGSQMNVDGGGSGGSRVAVDFGCS
ncbi:hypothetical protein ACFE04_020265 [Oxalis oulophora]